VWIWSAVVSVCRQPDSHSHEPHPAGPATMGLERKGHVFTYVAADFRSPERGRDAERRGLLHGLARRMGKLCTSTDRRVCHASCTFVVSIQPGGSKADRMTEQSDRQPDSSARGEAAWKEAREAIAARNQRAQKAGREQRQLYERQRDDARRAAEARAHARLLDSQQTP
jgi:hypothetical protein